MRGPFPFQVPAMRCKPSRTDRQFRSDFEAGLLKPHQFDHEAHVRLAYTYLTDGPADAAAARMRAALIDFLARHSLDVSKYHETLTRAWILAVRHFMEASPDTASAERFLASNRALLDRGILLRHYSPSLLFSARARGEFLEPDLEPIPRYG